MSTIADIEIDIDVTDAGAPEQANLQIYEHTAPSLSRNADVCSALESLIYKLISVGRMTPVTWSALVRAVTSVIANYEPPMRVARGKGAAKSSEEFTLALSVMVQDLQRLSRCCTVPSEALTFGELGASEATQLCPQDTWVMAASKGEFQWGVCQTSVVIERESFTLWYLARLRRIEQTRRDAVDRLYREHAAKIQASTALPAALTQQLRRLRDSMASYQGI